MIANASANFTGSDISKPKLSSIRTTPRFASARYWGPKRLTAPETFAAVITNKQLKIIADFAAKADG